MVKWDSSQECKVRLTTKNRLILYHCSKEHKGQKPHYYFNRYRKSILNITTQIHDKNSPKNWNRRALKLSLLKAISENCVGNIKVNVGRQYVFPDIWNKVRMSSFANSTQHCTRNSN